MSCANRENPWEAAPHPAIPSAADREGEGSKTDLGLLEHFDEKPQKIKLKPWSHMWRQLLVCGDCGARAKPHRPPSSYICIIAQAKGQRCQQPEGTLASQDKDRCFGVREAQTGGVQGVEGLTPGITVAAGTQLLREVAARQ